MYRLASHFWNAAHQAGASLQQDPWTAINLADDLIGSRNAGLLAPIVAYQTATAERGDKTPTFGASSAALLSMPLAGKLATSRWAMRFLAPMGGPLGWVGGFAASILVGSLASEIVHTSVYRTLRTLKTMEHDRIRLETGGRYTETRANWAWRAKAAQEMSGSFAAARTYLGNEGAFLHR